MEAATSALDRKLFGNSGGGGGGMFNEAVGKAVEANE